MNYTIAATIALCISTVHTNVLGSTKIFNHTPYPIKAVLAGAFHGKPTVQIDPGQMVKTLKGIESCVIITHVQIWVKEGNMDDYAATPTINETVYLDRCFKEIHVISTPNELGEYGYSITTSHE